MSQFERDGWCYQDPDLENGEDARKLVTLENAQGLRWTGIRAWHQAHRYWLNGGEPESDRIYAWKHLDSPAKGKWSHGQLQIFDISPPPTETQRERVQRIANDTGCTVTGDLCGMTVLWDQETSVTPMEVGAWEPDEGGLGITIGPAGSWTDGEWINRIVRPEVKP